MTRHIVLVGRIVPEADLAGAIYSMCSNSKQRLENNNTASLAFTLFGNQQTYELDRKQIHFYQGNICIDL